MTYQKLWLLIALLLLYASVVTSNDPTIVALRGAYVQSK